MNRKIYIIILLLIVGFTSDIEAQYNKRYLYYSASQAISGGNYRQAINLMSMLLENQQQDYEALFIRAVAKYNLNDLVGSERDLTSCIEYNSGYAQAYQYRAIVRSMMGNYKESLKDFGEALEIRPDFTDVYYSRGITYFLNQQFDKAISDFSHCIALKPDLEDAYVNRGAAYLLQKDTTLALTDYNKAIEINSRNSNIYVRRGNIFAAQGDYQRAYEDFNTAIKCDTLSTTAYFNRALSLAGQNKFNDAIEDFSKVISLDPRSSLTYFNRAIMRSQIGDYNSALEDYDKVVELTPNNVLGVYNRAMLNARMGNLINSLSDYTHAIELYPDFANAYLGRSNILYLLEDMEGSKRDHDTAQEKIEDYRTRVDRDNFEQMIDTSKTLNRLLSFDMDFGNGAFDKVQGKRFDIKQLQQFRISFDRYPDQLKLNREYTTTSLSNLLNSYGRNIVFTHKPITTSDNSTLAHLAKPEHSYVFSRNEQWKSYLFDGVIQGAQKQYANSIEMFNRAIQQQGDNPYLYASIAAAYSEMTEFISNIDTKGQRLVIGVDKGNELLNTNVIYSYQQALDNINKAIELDPSVAYFYYNRAVINCLKGDMTSAIEDYTKAIELYPNFAEALYNRGMILLYLKETQKGFLDLTLASDLDLKEAFEVLNDFGRVLAEEQK